MIDPDTITRLYGVRIRCRLAAKTSHRCVKAAWYRLDARIYASTVEILSSWN